MTAVARRRDAYTHEVEIEGGHSIVIDESRESGSAGAGPSPTRTLAAALAACTAITCEMYAARKGWELGEVSVEVEMTEDAKHSITGLEVTLRVPVELDDEQQRRLLVIAGKCPVHRALAGETAVTISDRIECG
ncbi:MAG: OsmC family peroxiredoxin [Solirubrobacterales bacterium]|nr:OsmC family peroxiredoxin [Solirubrobacterales bacterium]